MPRRLSTLPFVLVFVFVLVVGASVGCGSGSSSAPAEPAATAAPPAAEPAPAEPAAAVEGTTAAADAADARETDATTKYVPPIRGTADIAYVAPKTQVKNNTVITTIIVKNTSTGAIAGLKVEEYWWDKGNNPVTGDSVRLSTPLAPGETATVTLETPKDPRMFRNTYVFRHAFGQITATPVKSLE